MIPGWLAPADELVRLSRVNLVLLQDPPALHQMMAEAIAAEVRSSARAGRALALILPVGPRGQYPRLLEITHRERLSWKHVTIFHMDEYCDWKGEWVPADHPLSFRGQMERGFYSRLDPALAPAPGRVLYPDPRRPDDFPAAIEAAGGIETCYGGVGVHGHVAFNEPPRLPFGRVSAAEYRSAPTRLLSLNPETIVMNAIRAAGGEVATFPPMAVTVGMKEILAARRIRLYCDGGEWQRAALRMAALAEPAAEYPVSLLQGHPDYQICATLATAAPPGFHML